MEGKERGRPLLLSFSGVDGSGKTTQIENLLVALYGHGFKTRKLAFWDDVVVGVRYREGFVHQVYKSERGIGTPGKPVNRRDKNMRGWHLTLARHFLYLLDALHLCLVVARERRREGVVPAEAMVFDRYIYDELANLNLENALSRLFVRFVHRFIPRPDIAYLLDADPAAARARKPEYPVDFMVQCRQAYFDLAAQLRTMTIIPAMPLPETKQAVVAAAEEVISLKQSSSDRASRRLSAA
jgi:thymidylate kinase